VALTAASIDQEPFLIDLPTIATGTPLVAHVPTEAILDVVGHEI
jgi:hypothetical protein